MKNKNKRYKRDSNKKGTEHDGRDKFHMSLKTLTCTHCGDSLGVHVPSAKHSFSALPTNS